MAKRSRSRGIRPGRNAVVAGVFGLAGIASVAVGRGSTCAFHDGDGAPWLALGLFPALLGSAAFFYYCTTQRAYGPCAVAKA